MNRIWVGIIAVMFVLPFGTGSLASRTAEAGCWWGRSYYYPATSFYIGGVYGPVYAGPVYAPYGSVYVSRVSYTGYYGTYRWAAPSIWYPAYYSGWYPSGYYYYGPSASPYCCYSQTNRTESYTDTVATRSVPPLQNKSLVSTVSTNRAKWTNKVQEIPDWVYVAVRPSSLEDQLKALKAQSRGDQALSQGNHTKAIKSYRKAVNLASDKAEYRMSLAVALADRGDYSAATELIKSAMTLKHEFNDEVRSLKKIYGFNKRQQAVLVEGVKAWNRQSQEDPERLLLTGVMFYLNDESESAKPFLRMAQRTVNEKQTAETFLAQIEGGLENQVPLPEVNFPQEESDPLLAKQSFRLSAAPEPGK